VERIYDGRSILDARSWPGTKILLSSPEGRANFSFQLVGGIVMLVVTVGFKGSLSTAKSYATCTGVCQLAVDKMWRVLIGTVTISLVQAVY
jgi:hypothetical protein